MKPMIKIHNSETGEIIEREMNAAELAQLEIDQNVASVEREAEAARQSAKQAILDRLGITAEEAAILF